MSEFVTERPSLVVDGGAAGDVRRSPSAVAQLPGREDYESSMPAADMAVDRVLDAWVERDKDWLLSVERELQDLLVLESGEPEGHHAERALGRAEALLEVVRGAIRRLAAQDAAAAVTPNSLSHRMLLVLTEQPGLTNRALAETLGVDETQVSRSGRRIEELGLAWKRRIGRVNLWELTPRGQASLPGVAAGLPQVAGTGSVRLLAAVRTAFATLSEAAETAPTVSGPGLVDEVAAGEAQSPAVAERGVRLVADTPLVDRRPNNMFRLRPRQPCAVGVSLDSTGLVGVLVDPSAQLIGAPAFAPLPGSGPGQAAEAIATMTRELLRPHGSLTPLGLGVELSGDVDGRRGEVRLAPEFLDHGKPWQDVDLGQLLREATGLSAVVVENDANALALYELHFGVGRKHRDFSTVLVTERGVGAGIVLDGALLRGSGSAVGEMGHLPLGAQGQACRCGRRGCLETELTRLLAVAAQSTSPTDAARAATAAGDLLGRGVAVLLNVLGAHHVVVVGEGPSFNEHGVVSRKFRAAAQAAVEGCGFSTASLVEPFWLYGSREHRARGAAAAILHRYRPSALPEPAAAVRLLDALRDWGKHVAV